MPKGPSCQPHPENASGDFYVVDGCCTRCGVPEVEAPDIFALATSDPSHCVIAKQPRTPAEVDRTLNAIQAAELGCIRYRGRNRAIIRKLEQMGEGGQYDPSWAALLTRWMDKFRPAI